MGVTGLWRLIEPAGKPVPIETLENKVLAVDISIWLHQVVKGYQDAKGAPLPNAHLMGLFQRLCKLLYFRIKPIFVFDGAFPELKRETIAKRQDSKAKYNSESERLKRELARLLSKKTAISSLLGKQISPKKANANVNNEDDIFKLPALPEKEESESESEEETSSGSIIDLHSIDVESESFKNLPVKEKYDLLVEMKETRKMNSWGRLHELPKKSDNFSNFQMQRLLKRRKVQEVLEETEREMGDTGMSLNDLESLLNEEGIETKIDSFQTRRIASNNNTRFLLINNVKQALADAKKKQEENQATSKIKELTSEEIGPPRKDELECDLEKAIKMSMECSKEADTSVGTSKTDDSWTSFLSDSASEYTDSEEEDGYQEVTDLSSAKAYIMQYSDFTHKAIEDITSKTIKPLNKDKPKVPHVDEIIDELNKEKTIIADHIDVSSSEDDVQRQLEEDIDEDLELAIKMSLECVDNTENRSMKTNTNDVIENTVLSNTQEITQSSTICAISLDSSEEEMKPEPFQTLEEPRQSSTICAISLDSSEEEMKPKYFQTLDEPKPGTGTSNSGKLCSDSSTDESDFEEVPEMPIETFVTPVVQITLNTEAPEDDIFADVFENVAKPEQISKSPNIDHGPSTSTGLDVSKVNIISTKETDQDLGPSTSNVKVQTKETIIQNDESEHSSSTHDKNRNLRNTEEQSKYKTAINNSLSTEICNKPSTSKSSESSEMKTNKSNVKKIPKPVDPITTEKLNSMAENLLNEEQNLLQEKGKMDRIGRNITEQMTKDAQELLQIFGIPYIVAPMEAEAQCAFLESIELTDGTITDDSDIWLFGGKTVYKNFFNQKKHVIQFLAERIERSYNLTREQLILLAMLVGSDYTTGVTGVGPVTALEILASFPFNKKLLNETTKQSRYAQIVQGLQEFKKWVRAGKRTDNTTLKKKLKNVELSDDFPSVRVVQAYLEPNVEKSDEKFTWGELDITVLRDYAKAKFGWSQHKLDEIINPVLKRLKDRKSQKSVQDYFKRKIEFQSLEHQMSKRVKAAIEKMDPEYAEKEVESYTTAAKAKPVQKRKASNNVNAKIAENTEAGPSKPKQKKNAETKILMNQGVKVVSQTQDGKTSIQIQIPKTDRVQEIIPQREKDKQSLLQNKMKAIEIFRKTNIDRKKKLTKRKAKLPTKSADLSESDSD